MADDLTRRSVLGAGLAASVMAALPAAPRSGPARPQTGVRRFYEAADGPNLQPAFQRAIDWAGAHRNDIVSDLGPVKGEMWGTRRIGPDGPPGNGVPLVVSRGMAIDFAGATFRLKGPGGTARRGQTMPGGSQPWLGGWMLALGSGQGRPGIDRLELANVTVDGMFAGDLVTNRDSNVSDKGFALFDNGIDEVAMRNVELRNFAGEIYYIGGLGPPWQDIVDCHFHGSAQCAWNPGGTGRLRAVNLRAGRAYQCAEVIGGKGHVYTGGHFYQAGRAGSSFFGGPSPGFRSGYPYYHAWWDGRGQPPWVRFENTLFTGGGAVRLGSWMRGRIRLIDTGVYLATNVGHLRAVDLDIATVCDRRNNEPAVMFSGIDRPGTVLPGAPADAVYRPPSDIRLRIACSRTAAAKVAGRTFASPLRYNGGLFDARSVDVTVRGEARKLFEDFADGRVRQAPPRVRDAGFVPTR